VEKKEKQREFQLRIAKKMLMPSAAVDRPVCHSTPNSWEEAGRRWKWNSEERRNEG
jgi:hypothetical protein